MTTKPIPKIHKVGYVLFDYYTGECIDKGSLDQVLCTMVYQMATKSKSYEDFEVRMIVVDEVKTLSRIELEDAVKAFGRGREDDY